MNLWIGLGLSNSREREIRKYCNSINKEVSVSNVAFELPQHISLKSTFDTDKYTEISESLKKYFDEISAFMVRVEKVGTIPGIIWLEIEESLLLRKIHNDILKFIKDKYGIEKVGFDGDIFKFHSTLFFDMNNKEGISLLFDKFDKELFNDKTYLADKVYIGISESGEPGTYSIINCFNL